MKTVERPGVLVLGGSLFLFGGMSLAYWFTELRSALMSLDDDSSDHEKATVYHKLLLVLAYLNVAWAGVGAISGALVSNGGKVGRYTVYGLMFVGVLATNNYMIIYSRDSVMFGGDRGIEIYGYTAANVMAFATIAGTILSVLYMQNQGTDQGTDQETETKSSAPDSPVPSYAAIDGTEGDW